ncbi:MAG: hypothetical protein KJ018_09230 [Burkholderiales bacterium]|nr:hypothetical protein [Burkholderiales bacterium]
MEVTQLLVYALLIAGFMLFNFVLQRAARRARALQEQERPQQEALADAAEATPLDDTVWGREPRADRTPGARTDEPGPGAASPGVSSPVRRRVALFRDTDDLRRAVVAMTVLGPCRALDPPARW